MPSLRVHGQGRDKYENIRIGINGRLDTIQAAILLQKLTIFPDEIARRNHIAAVLYDQLLPESCGRPAVLDNTTSVWAQYTIRTANREHQLRNLKRERHTGDGVLPATAAPPAIL